MIKRLPERVPLALAFLSDSAAQKDARQVFQVVKGPC